MNDIKRILENQKEVKYLTYLVIIKNNGEIKLTLSTLGMDKNFLFSTETHCLSKIIDILFELKSLEKWMEQKLLKEKR